MVVENEISSFVGWLLRGEENWYEAAALQFLIIVVVLGLVAIAGGFVVMLVRYGPLTAGDRVYRTLATGAHDLARISSRRVMALAWLAVKEALRRRVLIGMAVYGLILVFTVWFLKPDNQDPAAVYLDFVLTATTYLMLALALLLSAFSLPADFESRTIYTVVTKPVRACDIVLGRILGFSALLTAMLAVMGVCSYFFVKGSLRHTHAVTELENVYDSEGELQVKRGTTTFDAFHEHEVEVYPDGQGVAFARFGHEHDIRTEGDDLVVGPPIGMLRARVPLRGDIRFYDRQGVLADRGVSVGAEWTYRSYIAGGTRAAAVWTFSGVDEDTLMPNADGDGRHLPVELFVRVFRTHKGEIERPIYGSIQLVNPDDRTKKSLLENFPAKDQSINSFTFPEKLVDADQQPIDLLDDLVSEEGQIEVWVQCLEGGQYFGFARADCYIRLPDTSPVWNFVKGHVGIWSQMVVVVAIGVTASTFLNGPIAALLTGSFLVLGYFRQFFVSVAEGTSYGGGPVESLVRLVTQKNLTTPFDESLGITVMKGLDAVFETLMRAVAAILPDFATLGSITYVSEGYSIPTAVVLRQVAICLAYVVGLSIAGYFFLRTREVAK